MTRSRFTARPPPIGRVKLAEPWEDTTNSDGLCLMSVTERNTSYLVTVGFSPATKGGCPGPHIHHWRSLSSKASRVHFMPLCIANKTPT